MAMPMDRKLGSKCTIFGDPGNNEVITVFQFAYAGDTLITVLNI